MIWKAIKGYEGLYEVSDRGQVKRIKEYCGRKGILKPHVWRRGVSKRGRTQKYLHVRLSKSNVTSTQLIHSLVANAFIGKKPFGYQINHKNFDVTDNRVSNLEYVTKAENVQHSLRNGRGRARLNEGMVKEIRLMSLTKRNTEIAILFGVSRAAISHVVSGRTWRHV